jgi:hypothetical protein
VRSIFRSSHGFESLPAAAWAHNGGGRAINLGTGGLIHIPVRDVQRLRTEVWYVGNLNGIIAIPFLASGHQLTGWALLAAAGVGVPDGGITVRVPIHE